MSESRRLSSWLRLHAFSTKRGPRFPDAQPTLSFHFCVLVFQAVQNQATARRTTKFALQFQYLSIGFYYLGPRKHATKVQYGDHFSFFLLLRHKSGSKSADGKTENFSLRFWHYFYFIFTCACCGDNLPLRRKKNFRLLSGRDFLLYKKSGAVTHIE